MNIQIVYNNEAREGLRSGWGFACLLNTDTEKILFDTGDNPEALLANLNALRVKPEEISTVLISHEHWDHNGGLEGFLAKASDGIRIIRPPDFIKPTEILPGIYTTGKLHSFGAPDEQSLFIKENKGCTVITGCSHPGVAKILDTVKSFGNITAIYGGLHGFDDFSLLEGMEKIGACHCTRHLDEIKERFAEQFIEIKAGDTITI